MPQFNKVPYQTKSPVLFLVFNRPDTTQQVFEQVRSAKPPRLYIAADGPRTGFKDDALLCKQTRDVVKNIDWECEVKTYFRAENVGCKYGVSAAIDWFFSQEDEGIVLEDDCLPANSFFKFCDVMLDKYRDDLRIRHITGCNLQDGKIWGDGSYYFSNRVHVWGWAGWKRAWSEYDITLEKYSSIDVKKYFVNIYGDELVAEAWTNIFNSVKAGQINSWAYPLDFATFFNNGLVIIPNQNLISNIGFKPGSTNTTRNFNSYANIPLDEIDHIIHPTTFLPEKSADLHIIYNHFGLRENAAKQNFFRRLYKRMINQH